MLVLASVHARMRCGVLSAAASQAPIGIAFAPLFGILLASTFAPTQAQTVTTDGTLPTTVIQDAAANQFTVTGGSAQGGNLFHSFDSFSPVDHSVLFDLRGDAFGSQIERIFSRVTGTSTSDINGSLTILGGNGPDLFLLNPNGIIFGPKVRLNLPGSFVGTTAESFQFADGLSFGKTDPLSPSPLLSISTPAGVQFGQNPGAISVLGNGHSIETISFFTPTLRDPTAPINGLSTSPGSTLALIGGPVQFDGAELQSPYQILPTGDSVLAGDIQLEVGAVEAGTVLLEEQVGGWRFDYSGIDTFQDIALTNRSWLNASGLTPGRIHLSGRNITVDEGSAVTINNFLAASDSNPTGITLRASESLKVQGNPSDSSFIRTTTTAQVPNPGVQQQAGAIDIESRNLQILDGGRISSATFGVGRGGPITIAVQENLTIDGQTASSRPISIRTGILTNTLASGNADSVSIQSGSMLLTSGGSLISSSFGTGDGGRVDIDVSGQVTIQEFNPFALLNSTIGSVSFREGNSGEGVFLKARQLNILDGGKLTSNAFGSGSVGRIGLDVSDAIRVGGLDSATSTQFGEIDASIRFDSVAANAFIQDQGNENFGDVRSITIQTPRLELFDQGKISVINQGEGDAGDVNIETHTLSLLDQSKISATTQAGDGGSVRVMAEESILLRQGSEISASSQQQGSGGNIFIKTPYLVAIPEENSDITANATSDLGGTISITASSVLGLSTQPALTEQSDITASSERGAQFNGSIELSQPDIDLTSGITELPSNVSDQDTTPVANACSSGSSPLARQGRGGLPLGPNNLLHDRLFLEGENDPINQAIALRNQGFYSKALQLLQKEIASPEMDAQTERQAIALRQLGITYKLLEQHKESRVALEQSLAISQRLNLPEQNSATLLSLGNLTRAKDKIEEARGYYRQALDVVPDAMLQHQILANQLSLEVAEGQDDG